MKITKAEYLSALYVVEKYHRQIKNDVNKHRIKIKDWLPTVKEDMPIRIFNFLELGVYNGTFEYLDEITRKRFLTIKGAGGKAWFQLEQFI